MPRSKNCLLIMAIAAMHFSGNANCVELRARDDTDDMYASDIASNFMESTQAQGGQAQASLAQAPKKADDNPDPKETDKTNKTTSTAILSENQDSNGDKQAPSTTTPPPESTPNKTPNGLLDMKKLLKETDQSMFVEKIISRSDGLMNLLYSDVQRLLSSVANDFPEIAKVSSIGRSNEGRDILVLELSMEKKEGVQPAARAQTSPPTSENVFLKEQHGRDRDDDDDSSDNSEKPKAPAAGLGHQVLAETSVMTGGQKPAILLTGATHAREMISTSLVVYEMLKLIQLGYMQKDPYFEKLLTQNKYYFMPIFNVDGSAFIEQNWIQTKKIVPKRKNTNPAFRCAPGQLDVDGGVDLNRNFGVDFGQIDDIVNFQGDLYRVDDLTGKNRDAKAAYKNPCNTNFAGPTAFSEPETQSFKNFLTSHQQELAFVINIHSNGNAFIYPFNGRQKNDIEERRPGIMQIFAQISKDAPFPSGTMKGTSKEVMGLALGGDQDDWTLDQLGVPSVTAELGFSGQFIDEWQLDNASTGNNIMKEQGAWMEYVFEHLPEYGKIVANQPQKTEIKQK